MHTLTRTRVGAALLALALALGLTASADAALRSNGDSADGNVRHGDDSNALRSN